VNFQRRLGFNPRLRETCVRRSGTGTRFRQYLIPLPIIISPMFQRNLFTFPSVPYSHADYYFTNVPTEVIHVSLSTLFPCRLLFHQCSNGSCSRFPQYLISMPIIISPMFQRNLFTFSSVPYSHADYYFTNVPKEFFTFPSVPYSYANYHFIDVSAEHRNICP
jgi:hypothetical protein